MGFAHDLRRDCIGTIGFAVMTRWSLLLVLFVALPAAAQPQPVAQPALPDRAGDRHRRHDCRRAGRARDPRRLPRRDEERQRDRPERAGADALRRDRDRAILERRQPRDHADALGGAGSRRINELLARPDLAGVVVTHGTDRLEETAFFLYLTVKSDKPVVVVGAQRPATGISPDGPINLLAAVRTAGSAKSRGMGVMVVMDDRILSARENRKLYPRTGGFSGGRDGHARRDGRAAARSSSSSPAARRRHGIRRHDRHDLAEGGAGILLSRRRGPQLGRRDTGAGGGAPQRVRAERARRLHRGQAQGHRDGAGVPERRARRRRPPAHPRRPAAGLQGGGPFAGQNQNLPPMVVVQHLLPQKARILLMLALTRTRDPREIPAHLQRVLMTRGSADLARLAAGLGAVAAVVAVREGAPRIERGDGVDHVPADRPGGRRDVSIVGRGRHVGRRHALLQLLLPAAGRHPDDCRPAELGCLVRVPGRQPRGEQPVGRGARADRGGVGTPRRVGAAVRPESRRAADHRQPAKPSSTLARSIARRFDLAFVAIALPRAGEWDVVEAGTADDRARHAASCRWPSPRRRRHSSSTPANAPMRAIAR